MAHLVTFHKTPQSTRRHRTLRLDIRFGRGRIAAKERKQSSDMRATRQCPYLTIAQTLLQPHHSEASQIAHPLTNNERLRVPMADPANATSSLSMASPRRPPFALLAVTLDVSSASAEQALPRIPFPAMS